MTAEKPSYYAIIPADVRYDDRIPPNAKLLYGEISALIGKEGFCYASNSYFMEVYEFSDSTITRLIKQLEDAGYVKRVLERDKTGQVTRRRIYLSVSLPDIQPPIIFDTTYPQKNEEGPPKNEGYTNTSNTNIPPLIPPEGERVNNKKSRSRGKDYKEAPDILPDRFSGFWTFYRTHIPQGRSAGNRQAAIRAWDRLAPSDATATSMAKALAKQVQTQAWKSGIGVPHASTWLNNHGWEDDWGAAADPMVAQPEDADSEEAAEWVS